MNQLSPDKLDIKLETVFVPGNQLSPQKFHIKLETVGVPGSILLIGLTLIPVLKSNYILFKCVVKSFFHSQTSMVQLSKFGNG